MLRRGLVLTLMLMLNTSIPFYPYTLMLLYLYTLIPLHPYTLMTLYLYDLIPLYPYTLTSLYPYTLIPLLGGDCRLTMWFVTPSERTRSEGGQQT